MSASDARGLHAPRRREVGAGDGLLGLEVTEQAQELSQAQLVERVDVLTGGASAVYGADAVIAMPPYTLRPDAETIYAYYQAINDVVDIPIWIQNASICPLSADQTVQLCTELENVSWVKEEVPPSTKNISRLLAKQSPHVEGVMGGGGGRPMIAEWARGSSGVVHACQFCDVVQRVWELLDENKMDEAGDLYEKVLPALVLEGMMGMACAKEIMVRRGVFNNHRVRSRAHPLDAYDMAEIDRVWERIQPYLIWGN